ncbi:Similar to Protein TED1; acc. no. P40533 [Pyronema omphalodes CBS 100304]|uniref:Similar to Protein TED1 acc. no. P40533 n=1 Tax=Pyronema omphalodes (strain CBS 100304) TaxID=1076935 RepID=U4LGH2_PYROM|nr:Similar to Protein TED1; acc. no. P40533 [Pyronema omphalodes CBS 100304]
MNVKGFFTLVFLDLLLPGLVLLNIYLYFYPVLWSCAFPRTSTNTDAPFRLLTLADPQLEGDTTLRKYTRRPRSLSELEHLSLSERVKLQISDALLATKRYGKILDLWGNDLYLSHVYRTMKRYTGPTHITVLGDQLGSQWISDTEFQKRSTRFWKIFSDATMVTEADLAAGHADGVEWKNKLIMMPGNHDVGYAGDINRYRLNRYTNAFGPFNYYLTYHPPDNSSFTTREPPELRLAVLNSLTLDAPIWDQSLQDESYAFLDGLMKNKSLYSTQATVLLTHLPLHKPAGVCVDGPEVILFEKRNGGGIRSQNFVSDTVSNLVKGWVFGYPGGNEPGSGSMPRGLIMTGHDHEGCDSVHHWDASNSSWAVSRQTEWKESGAEDKTESIREITVRSMMGEFSGNAGMLSAWFDWERNHWRFEYSSCKLGVQHVWWTTHTVNVIAVLWAVMLAVWNVVDFFVPTLKTKEEEEKKRQ